MKFQTIATGLMVGCALVSSAFVINRSLRDEPSRASLARVEYVKDWREVASIGVTLGSDSAAVTVVAFSDFQCPFCRGLLSFSDSLRASGQPIRVVYRHLISPAHAKARGAAAAFECAAQEGRANVMHRMLFELPDSLRSEAWWSLARLAGVTDSAAFQACLASEAVGARISEDSIAAIRLGVRGTPTLLFDSMKVTGLPSLDSLRRYVTWAARQAQPDGR